MRVVRTVIGPDQDGGSGMKVTSVVVVRLGISMALVVVEGLGMMVASVVVVRLGITIHWWCGWG